MEAAHILFPTTKIETIAEHKGENPFFPSEHLLLFVQNGSGRLRLNWYTQELDAPPYEDYYSVLLLNDTPLVRLQSSGCPTCESLLAAGYGLPEDCRELRIARDAVCRPYSGLEQAAGALQPILGLLRPGLYMLSYSGYFPTNGEGRFFWDVPDDLTAYKATAEIYESANLRVLPCCPCFLYPSQPGEKYDPAQVEHYRQMLRAGQTLPPVLAYSIQGYMSVLLDGHHRACACALEGVSVPCLTISVPGQLLREGVPHILWPDESESAIEGMLTQEQKTLFDGRYKSERIKPIPPFTHSIRFRRLWPGEYEAAARKYPTYTEAGYLMLYPKAELDEAGLRLLAQDEDYEDIEASASLLHYAVRQPGTDAKALAMALVGPDTPFDLRLAALEILDRIKGDPEIDDLMVQILVDSDRKDTPFYRIADKHWD